jgi:ADP-heptose:LPS heptosyltransferase
MTTHTNEGLLRRVAHMIGRHALSIPDGGAQNGPIELGRLKSILVLRLDEIGDVVLTSPFLRELRRNAPQARITLIVRPELRNLVEFCPYVDKVLSFNSRSAGRLAGFRRNLKALIFARRHLKGHFDLAMIPRWGADTQSATYLAYFSGASRRAAYSEHLHAAKARLNPGFDGLLTHAMGGIGPKHELEWNLDFLSSLGGRVTSSDLELWLTESDRQFVARTLSAHGVRERDPLIAFVPGAGVERRRWPIHRWIELGRRLQAEFGFRPALIGSDSERDLGAIIESDLGNIAINLIGRTTLRQTGAVLERCVLVVSNDTGPMHVAAAVGAPVVEISGHPLGGDADHESSPVHFGPWGIPHIVLQPEQPIPTCNGSCSSLEPHCILKIKVENVHEAVRKLSSTIGFRKPETSFAAGMD